MKIADLPRHHALLLTHNERRAFSRKLFDELEKSSPYHKFFDQTVLDIETARAIISWAQVSHPEEKIGVISFHTIGLEAQNALLKVLEEPKALVRFILITSNKASLIDTLLSRVHHIEISKGGEPLSHAEQFLKAKHKERMKLPYVVELLGKVDEEDRKDKESVRAFILSLAKALSERSGNAEYVLKILDAASYAALPSASGKTLLEYLSLLLPQVKV